jgi:hypothetical protein
MPFLIDAFMILSISSIMYEAHFCLKEERTYHPVLLNFDSSCCFLD